MGFLLHPHQFHRSLKTRSSPNMLLFRLSVALLLAASCLVTAFVASTERVTTCDDLYNVHRLECESGVVHVESALYGRADSITCSEGRPPNEISNTQCSQEGTTEVIRNRCNGQRACEINTNVVRTSDPCYGTYKYLQTNYRCLPAIHRTACENSLAHLSCDKGQVIFVYGADYGRSDQTTCSFGRPISQVQNVNCANPTKKVAEMCNGRNSCTVRALNSEFGDPCPGTYKYLEVAYVCELPGVPHKSY